MLTREELPDCPVATTLQLIGNKWKMLILRNLLTRPWRFNEMQRSIPGISQKVLTDNLRALEADGIITRTVYPEVPPRVEYALSELGESIEYEKWVTSHQNMKTIWFEIGVGYNTPGIIKYNFWQQVYRNEQAAYVCLNYEEQPVPEEIRDHSVMISGDSDQVIQELVS